jgi:membrane protease YdiL (CAAX protease family)
MWQWLEVLLKALTTYCWACAHRKLGIPWNLVLGAEVGAIIYALCAFTVLWIMASLLAGRPLAASGLTRIGFFKDTGVGFFAGFTVCALIYTLWICLMLYHLVNRNQHFALGYAIIDNIFAVATEEIAFRGYIFQTIERQRGTTQALLFSSLCFGLYHFRVYPPEQALLVGLELGMPFGCAYILTRRLWLPIGLHLGWDIGCIIVGAASGTENLYEWRFFPSSLLTGQGPFMNPVQIGVSLMCTALLWRLCVRRGQWRPKPKWGPNTPRNLEISDRPPTTLEADVTVG